MEKRKKERAAFDIILIAILMAAGIYATIRFGPYITRIADEPGKFRDMLISYGWVSIPLFMLLQAVQVIIAAIPGEVVQIAGGYIYGVIPGTFYSLIGIMAGSVIVFAVSRLLGYSLVKIFVSKKNLEKFNFMMNSNKSEMVMFVLFLIPGIPKDILTYIAGLTPIKPLRFFLTATIARFPALLATSVIGANLEAKNYTVVIAISVAAVILFAAGVLLKDKIIVKVQNVV